MSYTATFKKLDTGEAEFTGEIAANVFEGYRSHALEHLGGTMEVDGFRKGKAPESVLAKQIPEMAILEEMANHAIMDAYPKLLKEHNINPIGAPAVQITKIAPNNPLGFTIRTALMPEVTLPDYKKIAKETAKEVKVEVMDEEFSKAIEEVQKMHAQGVKENKERQAKEKGEENKTEGSESAEAPQALPQETESLPALTDDFVKTLGAFENVEDFKKKFRENMILEKTHREHEKNRLNIMEKILAESTSVIPNILIEAELDRMFYRMKADIQSMGLSYDDYMKHLGKSETDMRNELRADAEKRVKMEIIVSEIATKENIQPSAEEMAKQVEEIMKQYPGADKERAEAYIEQIMVNEGVFKLLEGK